MFFENYFYQDGLTASIMLSEKMDIEQLRTLPAKDKKLEVKEIFTIPNKPSDIEQFINNNHSEMREQTIFALQSYALRLKVYHDEIAKQLMFEYLKKNIKKGTIENFYVKLSE